jgi:hypothetical protein
MQKNSTLGGTVLSHLQPNRSPEGTPSENLSLTLGLGARFGLFSA